MVAVNRACPVAKLGEWGHYVQGVRASWLGWDCQAGQGDCACEVPEREDSFYRLNYLRALHVKLDDNDNEPDGEGVGLQLRRSHPVRMCAGPSAL